MEATKPNQPKSREAVDHNWDRAKIERLLRRADEDKQEGMLAYYSVLLRLIVF